MATHRSIGCLCALALLTLLIVPTAGAASLVSTFDGGHEGWTVNSSQGAGGVSDFAWLGNDGNPDGAIAATDIGNQGGWWFVAPAAWGGDWTAYIGGTIRFDVYASAGTSSTLNPPVEAAVLALDDGGRLRAKAAAGAALDTWVSVELSLTAQQFNLTDSGYSDFEQALAHVTGFIIPGDFVYQQGDRTRLDNVRVSAAPEPHSALLLLLGLSGLAFGRPRAARREPGPRGDDRSDDSSVGPGHPA